jgi:hypothetical protein
VAGLYVHDGPLADVHPRPSDQPARRVVHEQGVAGQVQRGAGEIRRYGVDSGHDAAPWRRSLSAIKRWTAGASAGTADRVIKPNTPQLWSMERTVSTSIGPTFERDDKSCR